MQRKHNQKWTKYTLIISKFKYATLEKCKRIWVTYNQNKFYSPRRRSSLYISWFLTFNLQFTVWWTQLPLYFVHLSVSSGKICNQSSGTWLGMIVTLAGVECNVTKLRSSSADVVYPLITGHSFLERSLNFYSLFPRSNSKILKVSTFVCNSTSKC